MFLKGFSAKKLKGCNGLSGGPQNQTGIFRGSLVPVETVPEEAGVAEAAEDWER